MGGKLEPKRERAWRWPCAFQVLPSTALGSGAGGRGAGPLHATALGLAWLAVPYSLLASPGQQVRKS